MPFLLRGWCSQITGLLCFKHWLYEVLRRTDSLPRWTAEIFISKSSFGLIGLIAGLALVIEDQHRHADLLMYILPKAMASAWRIAGGPRNWRKVTSVDGEVVVSAHHLSPSVGLDPLPLVIVQTRWPLWGWG